MKQVLQRARTGEITVEDVPAPQLLPGCVLVRVAASVVSAGTERASAEFAQKNLLQKARSRPDLVREVVSKVQRDGFLSALHAVRARLEQPQSPGYSSAGTVIAVSNEVTDIQPGDRVACAGAGIAVHAEVACVPRLLLARIPTRESNDDQVSFDESAFATLGAVALHGIRTGETRLGDLVAVVGLGLLGQLAVQLLKAAGCKVLGMDINPARADLARRLSADGVATSTSVFRELCLEASHGAGVDVVLITAETPSSEPVNLAGAIARDRAVVVAVGTVGIDIERKSYYEKELDFRISRSYGPGRYDTAFEQKGRDYPIGYVRWTETRNMEAFLDLLAQRKIDVSSLITHRFPVDSAQNAYDLITSHSAEPFLGVLIQYPGTGDSSFRTLSLTSTPQDIEQPARCDSEIRVGLLGAGGFATSTLIPAMQSLKATSLISVCAATGSHAQHAARRFRFQHSTTDELEVLQNPAINTVVIATRNHLHARQVIAAIKSRKHVFCEKPLCLTEEELCAIVQSYTRTESPRPLLMVGFNRRFAQMISRMKSFLQEISEPLALNYRINAGYLSPDHWMNDPEQGGGRVLGEVCHFVDLLTFLAHSPILEVGGEWLGDSARYTGANAIVSLRFANGSQGTISYLANGDRSFSKERIEVFGGGSTAVLDDFRRLELIRNGRKQTVRSRWRQDKGHQAEWAAFVSSVQNNTVPPISFEEIVRSTMATLCVQKSLATGAPVTVNLSSMDVEPTSNLSLTHSR
jgi:predicted dehydrogenase/threonine dehydrogenase-like Zn-dependent dehydrogenase